jgi:hypothetical protein
VPEVRRKLGVDVPLLLLGITFALLWRFIALHRDALGFGNLSIRGAFVLAFLGFELLILGISEITSIDRHFTSHVVIGAWGALVVILLVMNRPSTNRTDRPSRAIATSIGRIRELDLRAHLDGEDRVWTAAIVAIFGVLAVVAWLYLPANTDSLVYHLARVEHWIQNRSIAPFATHYLGQIELSPLAEYNLAHIHLLTGGDQFDAFVQWTAALVSVIAVSELARLLGAPRTAQVTASVICATIPSGILLATSTENDYFAAATGIGLLVVLASLSFERRWSRQAVAAGCAAGLGYMAKGTIPTMLGPATLILVCVAVFRYRRAEQRQARTLLRPIAAWCAVAAVGTLAVAGPFLVQNIQLFGSPIGPVSRSTVSSSLTPNAAASNVIRNAALNFQIGNGTSGLDTYVSMVALGVLGRAYTSLDVSPGDWRYTLTQDRGTFTVRDHTFDNRLGDFGANPWHVILLICTIFVLLVGVLRRSSNLRVAFALAVGLSVGYFLFTGTARWSNFNVRYALPLFVAWCPLIAIGLTRFPRWVGRFVLMALVVACLPQLLDNAARPLVPPRTHFASSLEPYFIDFGTTSPVEEASAYESITNALAGSTCRQAALGNQVLFEYPLWVGLQFDHWKGTLNDFEVHNPSRRLEPTYRPCAWIRQEGPRYNTPNNGTVNLQFNDLALSIDPSRAQSIHMPIPGFTSAVPGVRVFPGGGWSLVALGHDPLLGGHGSIYLFSPTAQRVQLQLHLVPNAPQPSLTLSEPDLQSISSVVGPDVITAELTLHHGINQIDLVAGPSAATSKLVLVLSGVSIGTAPS